MELKNINSYSELVKELKLTEKGFVLLYKAGSDTSECALSRLENQKLNKDNKLSLLKVNVANVRDIHPKYSITSVPSLLQFEKEDLKNIIKGCMTVDYYNSVINGIYNKVIIDGVEMKQKRVTVYGTPTCTWCNRIKDYFKANNIRYEYVDVSVDQNRAEEMKRKSGQMGVPQTEIEGQMIVGFDKPKINRLLGLN